MMTLADFAKNHKSKLITVVILTVLGVGSVFFFGQDNDIEELSEMGIKAETGLDIDLSPKSPEVKK